MPEPLYVKNERFFTQIGSLPYTDVDLAVDYSLRNSIPFLPELPKLGDTTFYCVENPGKSSCLEKFKAEVKKRNLDTVKIQCVGPQTLIRNKRGHLLDNIYQHIDALFDGLIAKEIIFFFDEPAIDGVAFDSYEESWKEIKDYIENYGPKPNVPILYGIHNCGDMATVWDGLFSSDVIDIINFDASQYKLSLFKTQNERKSKRIA